MIAMAIEAARQLAGRVYDIRGFNLKNMVFRRALVLTSNPEGVETRLHLRCQDSTNTKSSQELLLYALRIFERRVVYYM